MSDPKKIMKMIQNPRELKIAIAQPKSPLTKNASCATIVAKKLKCGLSLRI